MLFPEGRDKGTVLNDFLSLLWPSAPPACFGLASGCCLMSLCSHWEAAGLSGIAAAGSGFTLFITYLPYLSLPSSMVMKGDH